MATPFTVQRINSERKKDKATVEGFIYTLNRYSNDIEYWVCEKRGVCKARIHTRSNNIIKPTTSSELISEHCHGPDSAKLEMLKAYNRLKTEASESEMSTRSLLSKAVQSLPAESINKLPKLDSVKKTIRNCKRIQDDDFGNPTTCAEIVIPNSYALTHKGENFLLFDSGIGDVNRLLLFGTPKFLNLLKESVSWYCDGTFKVVPEHFFQLYTIHAQKDGYLFPCVYALLNSKSESTYDRIFLKLLEIEPVLNPSSIMVDFEKASMNSLETHFIASISGCFFHLAQNIYRKIQSEGLSSQYNQDMEYGIKLKMLASLAFVPEHDVIDSFTILMT